MRAFVTYRRIVPARRSRSGIYARLLALLVFALVVSGCARAEVTDEPPRYVEPGDGGQVSQVGQGGTARVALPLSMKPSCFNPYLPSCRGSENLSGVVFEGLLSIGPSGEYRPLLGQNVPSYSDGTLSLEPSTIEVRLREGASFSDGEKVTGDDVKWTYEQAAALAEEGEVSAPYSGFRRVESVEVEGSENRVVRIKLDGPYSEWRDLLTAPVLPEHVYGGAEDGGLGALSLVSEPVGSGPFLLDEFGARGLSFTASPRYWVEDGLQFPRLDGFEIEYESSPEAYESLASERANFGLFAAGDAPDSGSLLRDPAMKSRNELLLFNPATLDGTDRSALSASLDRNAVAKAAGFEPSQSVFPGYALPEDAPGWASLKTPSSSGSLGGREVRLVYPLGGPARERAVAEVVSGFEAAGAKVSARRLSAADFYGDALRTGDFDVALFAVDSLGEYEALSGVLPEKSSYAVSASLGATEEQGRYLVRTQEIMADEAALVPLYTWPDSYAWSSTLSGPRSGVPARALFWNVRDWGFFK